MDEYRNVVIKRAFVRFVMEARGAEVQLGDRG